MYSDIRQIGKIVCTPALSAIEALVNSTIAVVTYHKQMVFVVGVNHHAGEVQIIIGDWERLCTFMECLPTVIGTPQIPCTDNIHTVRVGTCKLIAIEILALAVKHLLERSTLIVR